jgi:hypothetical protein
MNVETAQARFSKHEYLIKLSELTLKDIVNFSSWITDSGLDQLDSL